MNYIKAFILILLPALFIISCSKKSNPAPPATPRDTIPAIDSSYRGGIIFYLDSTGKHGLIATSGDLPYAAAWGCEGTLTGASGTSVGTGSANTLAILNGCDSAGTAAMACHNLPYGGYTDWYLPSKDELNLMYTNLYKKYGQGFSTGYYWSSSEINSTNAWFQYFGNGAQIAATKDIQFYVRAARTF